MAKRKHNRSEDEEAAAEGLEPRGSRSDGDESLGLTEAFAPITDEQLDYDYTEGDDPIGLTQAFGPIRVDDDGEGERQDSEGGAWRSDGWGSADAAYGAAYEEQQGGEAPHDEPRAEAPARGAYEQAAADAMGDLPDGQAKGRHAAGFKYEPDNGEDYPDVVDSLEPKDEPPLLMEDEQAPSNNGAAKPKHGKHGRVAEISPQAKKARRLRRTLIVIIIIVLVLAVALGYFAFRIFGESRDVAQQTQQQSASQTSALSSNAGSDASTQVARTVQPPNLASVLGLSQDAAIQSIGHGAQATATSDVTSDDSNVVSQVTVTLMDDPVDAKTGTPTVYLGLDEDGNVVQAGYSTSTASLGYGASAFDALVTNDHVVERTLTEAGVSVPDGAAVLPADKSTYTTYASDGRTPSRERCSFSGDVEVNGTPCTWSSVLSYDYATANLTGDLSDTVRIIYVYVTQK